MPKLYQGSEEEQYYISIQEIGGSLRARIVDNSGNHVWAGLLFDITTDGRLLLHYNVNTDAAHKAGIQLDSNNQIKTKEA